jgi:DNA-binding NarL/FixJ family response regulator
VRISILLADDNAGFRRGLRAFLDSFPSLHVIAEAASGRQAIEMARLHQPDVALLDIRMRDLNGIDAIPAILECSPKTAIMMLTMHGDKRYVDRSIKAGARGFLLKDVADSVIVDGIRSLHDGNSYFGVTLSQAPS